MENAAENTALLREAYALWHDSKGGSVDHWMGLIAENVSFGSVAGGAVPTLPFATYYDSRRALHGYFEMLLRDWEMIYFNAQEFVAQGEAVVMRGSTAWRNRSTGKVFATPKLDFWRFRNGKAIEFFEYFDRRRPGRDRIVNEAACSKIASRSGRSARAGRPPC